MLKQNRWQKLLLQSQRWRTKLILVLYHYSTKSSNTDCVPLLITSSTGLHISSDKPTSNVTSTNESLDLFGTSSMSRHSQRPRRPCRAAVPSLRCHGHKATMRISDCCHSFRENRRQTYQARIEIPCHTPLAMRVSIRLNAQPHPGPLQHQAIGSGQHSRPDFTIGPIVSASRPDPAQRLALLACRLYHVTAPSHQPASAAHLDCATVAARAHQARPRLGQSAKPAAASASKSAHTCSHRPSPRVPVPRSCHSPLACISAFTAAQAAMSRGGAVSSLSRP